jgi:transitional endoplasmic reticulum ATPase
MGEAGNLMPNEASLSQVFEGFKEHFNGRRTSTELTLLEIIRKSHPESSVTITQPASCDLMGYASAGLATAKMESSEAFDTTRSYVAPRPRLENKTGVLNDHVRFGRWAYTWKNSEFILYEVEYQEPFKQPTKLYFILSPRSLGTDLMHHPVTDELILAVGEWTTELHDEIYVFDDGRWNKNKELWKSVQGASWDEVILNPGMKANLIKDVQSFFDNRELYKKLSVPWKRGLILHGVPGNGKTISIKALINELQKRPEPIPSLYVKAFDSCNGKKFSIRAIFTQARTMAPCLLIFEDLDSLVEDKTRSYFLNEVDGLESNDGILMVGSTNHLDGLDPAISKRPSRFDRKYHFKIPSEAERTAYCQFWREKVLNSGMVDFPEEMCPIVAKLTEGFSFAYLKELFVIALLTIARGGVQVEDEKLANEAQKPITKAGSEEGKKVGEKEKKRAVPEVEIPAELKDNLLLKVLGAEIKALLEEMDNTKEEDWLSDKKKTGGVSSGMPMMVRAQPIEN